jgi:t-SNARE complex subunit (syntaxin)
MSFACWISIGSLGLGRSYSDILTSIFIKSLPFFFKSPLLPLSPFPLFRYKAQSDVLRQLEQRLREQILSQRQRYSQNVNQDDSSSTQKQALLKLERDFERVQTSVQTTKAKVSRQMKQYQQRQAAAAAVAGNDNTYSGDNMSTSASNNTMLLQQQYAQQQLQLQQDRLQEEIMREREEEIRKINRGMHQVNEIYKDLAHIVGSQQEQVDQIEDKMEDARNTAQSGLDQVHKANEKFGTNQCSIS